MAKVEVVRNEALSEAASKDGNLTRTTAFQHREVWAGYARVGAGKNSGWHHLGENDTYMYALSGEGRLDSGPGGKDSVDLKPSDAALIPAHTIHREVTGTAELTGFVVRVGRGPFVFPADGPE